MIDKGDKPRMITVDHNRTQSQCLKITANVAFEFSYFDIFHFFWPVKSDLSGNTLTAMLNATFSAIFKHCA